MRTFYVFKINNMFQNFYNDKTNVLYNMFNDIYNGSKDDLMNNFRLFEQITVPFNKRLFNNYILLKHKNDLYYSKNGNIHMINNVDELSRLTINTTHLKIKSNVNINTFIKDIKETNECVFVIDFDNKDYFYLNEFNLETIV